MKETKADNSASRFFSKVFTNEICGSLAKDSLALIWQITPDSTLKESAWVNTAEDVEKLVEKEKLQRHIYYGLCLAEEKAISKVPEKRKSTRATIEQLKAMVCLWADVDFLDDTHQKTNLPKTIEDCIALVEEMPLSPSIIVSTGHGIQALWLFDEPLLLESQEKREFAIELSVRWQRLLQAKAKDKGWSVDSTFDLTRVFRLPGSLNHKDPDNLKEVLIIQENDNSFPAEYYEAQLNLDPKSACIESYKSAAYSTDYLTTIDFEIRPEANPPFTKFEALVENNEKFRNTWLKKRKDLQDNSPSGYDLSLASFCIAANWGNQEVVDTLIAFRRKHELKEKLRIDYYTDTLNRARKNQRTDESKKAVSAPLSDERGENLKNIGDSLGIPLIGISKFNSDPPTYIIHLQGGRQIEASSKTFLNQSSMRVTLFERLNYQMPKFKADEWEELLKKVLAVIEEIDPMTASTDLGSTAVWLYHYLSSSQAMDGEKDEESQSTRLLSKRPACLAGDLVFDFSSFMHYIYSEYNERPDKGKLDQRLQRLGCRKTKKSIVLPGLKRTSRMLYAVSKTMEKEPERLLAIAEAISGAGDSN